MSMLYTSDSKDSAGDLQPSPLLPPDHSFEAHRSYQQEGHGEANEPYPMPALTPSMSNPSEDTETALVKVESPDSPMEVGAQDTWYPSSAQSLCAPFTALMAPCMPASSATSERVEGRPLLGEHPMGYQTQYAPQAPLTLLKQDERSGELPSMLFHERHTQTTMLPPIQTLPSPVSSDHRSTTHQLDLYVSVGLASSNNDLDHTTHHEVASNYDSMPVDPVGPIEPSITIADQPSSAEPASGTHHFNSLASRYPVHRTGRPKNIFTTTPWKSPQSTTAGGSRKKRQPFRSSQARQETAETRKLGSCVRCRLQRVRCGRNPADPTGPCQTCLEVTGMRPGMMPCLRYKIMDIKLFKPGPVTGYEWSMRWEHGLCDPIKKWASTRTRPIEVAQGFCNHSIQLRVAQFIPEAGDKTHRTWHDGVKMCSVEIPPFAMIDLAAGQNRYEEYLQTCVNNSFLQSLGPPRSLMYQTYSRAVKLLKKDSKASSEAQEIIALTLKLWTCIRLSTTSWHIVGQDTLGMPGNVIDDPSSPDCGKVPIPPVLGAQLDAILIHQLQTPLRRDLLRLLSKIIIKNRRSDWFTTYLVIFILLHNTSLIIAHDARYAQKHGMARRFARPSMVNEYINGANTLLAHFHYCNKGVFPFTDECSAGELKVKGELDDETVSFVQATKMHVRDHENFPIERRCRYEMEEFFICQLYEKAWRPHDETNVPRYLVD